MRQQYHARTVNGRQHVWDITKLVKNIHSHPIFEIALNDIQELNEAYWHTETDGTFQKPIVRDIALHAMLIQQCDLSYPIILHADGALMDGMHRCCKALIAGHTTIKAVKFEADPEPDFIDPDWNALPYHDTFFKTLEHFGLPHKS